MKVVVIGASHAGVGFVDAMRRRGFDGDLTLIDRQSGLPMERPPLSKAFLLDDGDEAKFALRKPEWYRQCDVQLQDGCEVLTIDAAGHDLVLGNGRRIAYDRLVLAMGARPRHLPSTGNLDGVFVLRDPGDARRLRAAASAAGSAIIVGGGYIGLEVAASLTRAGKKVTVIEAAPNLLARVASRPISDFFRDLHCGQGVEVITGSSVASVMEAGGRFTGVVLADGQRVGADMLVVGIGVDPETALAEQAGIETANGIIVDQDMRTNIADIYAIGDGAMQRDGRYAMRLESVHNAQESAEIAAAAMLGAAPPKRQAPWFWSDQFDLKLQSVGILPEARDDLRHVRRAGRRENAFSVWSFRGPELVAVEAVRDPAGYMAGKSCLENGMAPAPEQLADPDFDLKAFVADKQVA